MKRKALLIVADCTAKFFETCSARGFNPVTITDRAWSDYSLNDAFELRLLQQAFKGTDLDSAALIARRALDAISPMSPFAYTDGEELWVALVRYDWADAPEEWDCRQVIGGRLQDIHVKAEEFVKGLDAAAKVTSVYLIHMTKIAQHVWKEARDLGLPEGDEYPVIPEDLTGYPKWFQEVERARRAVAFDTGEAE